MEISRVTPLGTQNQSMGTKEICILVVNDDHTCRNIVTYMLQHPINSEVYHFETVTEALNIIGERKDKLELLLTNVHRTDTYRFGVIQHIEKEFKLPIILMNPENGTEIMSHAQGSETTICFLKSLSMEDINNIWESALAREKGECVAFKGAGSDKQESMHHNKETGEETRVYRKRKKKENKEISEEKEGSRDDSTIEKKPRVVWNGEMHKKFEEAIKQLGHERAFPKKIVEVMNIPGLTRENVASHLQKYRMMQKKNPERIMDSYYGMPSGHPSLTFNSSIGNYQKHHWRPSSASLINSEASISMSKFRQSDSSFRLCGDQNKNILLSIKNSRQPSNLDASGSFMGLQLVNGGKSIEFGHTRVLSTDETAKEVDFPVVEDSGNQNFVEYPLTSGNCDSLHEEPSFPPLSSFLPIFETTGNQNFDQCPSSIPLLGTSGNEKYRELACGLPILETHGNENSDQFPYSLPILRTDWNENSSQFPCNLPILKTGQNENSSQFSSYPFLLETGWKENSDQGPNGLPLSSTGQNSNSGQSPLLSNDSILEQQSSMPFLGSCENVSSVQYTFNCVSQEEASLPPLPPLLDEFDSFAPDRDLDVQLNTSGSTSAQVFWDGDFDDTLFCHTD